MKFQSSALLFATFVTPGNAFVPTAPSSSLGTSSFVQRAPTPVSTMTSTFSTTNMARPTTALNMQMNLFDRFIRVAKGNFNNVLNSLEAPEKIMNQAMIDMQVSHAYLDTT